MRVAIFGLGYVGTVTAACLASKGHEVCGVDIDSAKVTMVAAGESPVVEPDLAPLVASNVAAGRLRTTSDPQQALEGAEVSIVCVGTPSSLNGGTDLSYVLRAVEEISAALGAVKPARNGHVVVIRSTVPPGTVDEVVRPLLPGSVATAMCPEFLREGSGVADFFDPPFSVVGTSDAAAAAAMSQLLGFLDDPVRIVDTRTAEALKYACNAFHATKVAFANELARVFRPLGIDSREVMEHFCDDDRLNISPSYLRPGFAFGGPCLGKDLRSLLHLARVNSVDVPLLAGTVSSNDLTVADVVNRVTSRTGRKVAILGLSFKASSDDLRESPNVQLAETLIGKGYELRIHDPIVKPSKLVGANRAFVEGRLPHLRQLLADTAAEALEGADVAVVSSKDLAVTEALLATPPPVLIDLTGRLGSAVEALAGYEGLGW
ncbi:MAG: UDP-glucose dehydrogenase family protein [Acidimicrobiales bacterium]